MIKRLVVTGLVVVIFVGGVAFGFQAWIRKANQIGETIG
ncbi:MAG: hypothetical protein AOA65_0562 [Candidatus Bathyarchaeota archaeon BA1]|nr:MAG: hypothetical protein AOA65_0562 [Candidatus Bathyarchaeota archaeon BA1]